MHYGILSLNNGDTKVEYQNDLYDEAVHYQEFHDKVTDNNGTNLSNPDIKSIR